MKNQSEKNLVSCEIELKDGKLSAWSDDEDHGADIS